MNQVRHYSAFLNSLASLVGIPATRITTELAGTFQTLFNTAMQTMWVMGPWVEITPRGEARFVGNRLTYCNNLANTTAWTATAVTVTANSVQNPADGAITGSRILETVANSAHKVVEAVATFFPSTEYAISFYGRPLGRYVQLAVSDGVTTYSAFFNLVAGTVGTTANFETVTISQQPNGFWLCRCTLTANAAATASGSYTVSMSSDGSTLSYAGDVTKGAYIWGCLVQQVSNVPLNDCLLPWDQAGENVIDAVFDVYANSPMSIQNPTRLSYNLTPGGIQLINASPIAYNYYVNGVAQQSIFGAVPSNPLFIYYRKACPSFTGDTFDAAATYAVDEQMYFVNSIDNGDYYKCIVATTAGQDPDDTPASWERLTIYDTFFNFALFQSYGDWLISDGQMDKATGAYTIAQKKMDDQFDARERQAGDVLPVKMQTHLTAQQRWM